MNHENKDALIAELQSKHPCAPFREESKRFIHTQAHVDGFELCHLSPQSSMSSLYRILGGRNCFLCLRFLSVSHRCDTKIEQREIRRFDNSPTPRSRKGRTGVLVKVELRTSEHTTMQRMARKRRTRKDSSQSFIVFRREIYRSSQTNVGRAEEFCRHLGELAKEDPYVANRQERERHGNVWTTNLDGQ